MARQKKPVHRVQMTDSLHRCDYLLCKGQRRDPKACSLRNSGN